MSDRKLADLSGIHYTHICRLRTERSRTTLATASKLLGALGVSTYQWTPEIETAFKKVVEDLMAGAV